MLRILVISLFVANLLLLGFQKDNPVVQPETTVTQSVVQDSTIPTIHLFSEMIEDQDLLSGNRRCFSLGPFNAIEDQDEIRTRLQEVSTIISERQTEALVEKGYWVFMPPYTSLLEANEEVMSLQALGFKDISVVLGGDWKNAVSLGYFMRQENALRRKKDLAAIEPFDGFEFRVAGWATIVIFVVGLLVSLVSPMAYCRFGCPTGAVLNFLRFRADSHRLGLSRSFPND